MNEPMNVCGLDLGGFEEAGAAPKKLCTAGEVFVTGIAVIIIIVMESISGWMACN